MIPRLIRIVFCSDNLTVKIDGINGNGVILKPINKIEKMDEDESTGI